MERPDRVDSPGAFTAALEAVLDAAHRNDVPVEGGWLVETDGDERPDWDVEVWRVVQASDEA